MHCPHKSPHFLSIQETVTHSLAPDILQVSVCLEIVLPIKTCLSMKTSTGMWPYRWWVICCLRANAEIESCCDECRVYSNKTQWDINCPITDMSGLGEQAGYKTRLHQMNTSSNQTSLSPTHSFTESVLAALPPFLFFLQFLSPSADL